MNLHFRDYTAQMAQFSLGESVLLSPYIFLPLSVITFTPQHSFLLSHRLFDTGILQPNILYSTQLNMALV